MAHIDWIAFHSRNQANGTMRLTVDLKPSGNVSIDVPLPEDLHAVIMKIAQTAADAHEAQMHAEILGERYVRTDVPQAHPPQAPAEEADSQTETTFPNVCTGQSFQNIQQKPQADSTKEAAISAIEAEMCNYTDEPRPGTCRDESGYYHQIKQPKDI